MEARLENGNDIVTNRTQAKNEYVNRRALNELVTCPTQPADLFSCHDIRFRDRGYAMVMLQPSSESTTID